MHKYMIKHRRAVILLLTIVLVIISDIILFHTGDINATDPSVFSTTFTVSNTTSYFYFQANTSGPSYFFSAGKVYQSISNPYANEIGIFNVYMSTDNSSWVAIPFSNTEKLVEIGEVQLNSFSIKIYVKYFFPPQPVVNETVSVKTIEESFIGKTIIKIPYTPQTDIIIFLVTVAMFSFILQILDFLFKPTTA